MAYIPFEDLTQVSLADIKQLTLNAKDAIYARAEQIGICPKIYLHWTAGWYDRPDDDYTINIDKDGKIFITTEDFSERLAHTELRNSASIGIAICSCALASTSDLGEAPPTTEEIEVMCMVTAVIAAALEIPIDIEHVMTHGEAADNLDGYEATPPYGPDSTCERWDLAILKNGDEWKSGGDTLRGKANWYQEQYPDGVENHV